MFTEGKQSLLIVLQAPDAAGKDDFNIVFTSLHGTSITAIPEVLKRAGYKNVTIIEEQAKPDGNFPTVVSPNPEEPEALSMAIKKAQEIGADMVVGTDPDGDRLGIADFGYTLVHGKCFAKRTCFLKYFPDAEIPVTQVKSDRSACLRIGAFIVVNFQFLNNKLFNPLNVRV